MLTRGLLIMGAAAMAAASVAGGHRVGVGSGWIEFDGPRYAISLDGSEVVDQGATNRQIRLRYAEFDPLNGEPQVPSGLASAGGSWIIQFWTPTIGAYRRKLASLGEREPIYLPANAFLARLTEKGARKLAAWAPVRWVGPYRPAYRIEPEILNDLRNGVFSARRVFVQVFDRSAYTRESVASRVRMIGGRVDNVPSDGYWIEATLSASQITGVACWPDVVWIDRWSPPEADMDIAREIGGAAQLETLEGIAGSGVRGEVFDTNVRDTHADFAARPLLFHGPRGGSFFHGTSTTGIVFGDGASDQRARGMLPLGQGIFADFELLNDRYRHTRELKQSPYYAVFQSNSWGNTLTTQYTSTSAQLDDIIFQNDILICQSQSNDGSQNSRPQAWSKNIVSVGGISHFGTLTKTDDRWTSASYGPAADGRLKPDLSHFYDSIYTVSEASDTSHTSGFGGTSGATPIVAGHFGLLFEMWSKGLFGNTVVGSTVFDAAPKFTLAKAFLVNSASPYPFTGRSANLSRYRQGWGLPDAGQLFNSKLNSLFVNETDVLGPFERRSYRVHVPAGQPWLRATMTYADLPGTTSSSQHRINKLNLRVVAPSGAVYWGNNGLTDGNASTPGGEPNNVDTLENVFIPNPSSGTWTIEVWARELNADGRTETPGVIDADYALVVSGVAYGFAPAEVAATEGTVEAGDLTSTVLSDDGRLVLENAVGPGVGLEARIVMPHGLADRLTFRVESRSVGADAEVTVAVLNVGTGAYEVVGGGPQDATDGLVVVSAERARRFIDPSRNVTIRLTWRRTDGDGPASIGLDQVRAFFTPLAGIGSSRR